MRLQGALIALTLAVAAPAQAVDLAAASDWPALAADRIAGRVGDSLTVLIYENASAANSAQAASRRDTALQGEVVGADVQQGRLAFEGRYKGEGQSGRSDRMVAQISVQVMGVEPGGDLLLAGEQELVVNGHKTRISVAGRARPSDISTANTILSSRLSQARITYDGEGFSSRAARPGLVADLLSKLGIF